MIYKKLNSGSPHDNPKKNAGFFSLLTFAWLNGLLKQGSESPLENDDLPPLLKEDQSQELTQNLESLWFLSRCNETRGRAKSKRLIKTARLWRALLGLVPASEKVFVMMLTTTLTVVRVMQPLFLIGLLVELRKESPIYQKWIYLYAAGVCLCAWVIAIFKCHCDYRSAMIGMRIRSALLGLIYKKVQQISLSQLTKMTTGHVINLISNDVQRFHLAMQNFSYVLTAPFGFVAGNVIMYYFIGWPSLIGTGYLLVILIYQGYKSKLAAKLRQKVVVLADRRVKIINEIIRGIRTIKICSWEKYFENLVSGVRGKEIKLIRKISAVQASIKTTVSTTPRMTSLAIFSAYLLSGHSLTLVSVFIVFANAVVLGIFIKNLGKHLRLLTDCNMSVGRIENFLDTVEDSCWDDKKQLEAGSSKKKYAKQRVVFLESKSRVTSKESPYNNDNKDDDHLHRKQKAFVSLADACCNADNDKMLFKNVSFRSQGPQLIIITGPVGSGKTSLLLAILGELPICKGFLERKGEMAFVGQSPWIFSGTLRDNVTFNKPFDPTKFHKIMDACALSKDIEQFPEGDLTIVGERGIVLSGGQRTRVSMARALYSDADMYLLDDPLSCVDADVGSHIFENYVGSALSDRLCLLVTHQPYYMKHANHIIVMNEGSIAWQGSYSEIASMEPVGVPGLEKIFANEYSLNSSTNYDSATREKRNFEDSSETSLIIPKEDRNFGSVSYKTYWKYFRAGLPRCLLVLLVTLSTFALLSQVFPDWIMAQWKDVSWSSSSDRSHFFLFTGLALGSTTLLFFSAFLFYQATINSSRNLHKKMLQVILRNPLHFFDTNSSGRISNRFSKDIGLMDELLFVAFYDLVEISCGMLLAVGVPSVANFWVLFSVIPLAGLVMYYGRYCFKTSRDVARMQAINRSPLYSHFTLTLDGIVSIRTYHQEDNFLKEFYKHQDKLTATWFVLIGVARWLHFRMDCITSLFLTVVTAIAVMTSQHAGLTALAIIYCMNLLECLDFTVRQSLEVEKMMTSVERVISYTNLDTEPGYSAGKEPPRDWPVEGRIEVKDLRLVYYNGGPEVLRDLNFSFSPGEKIGIAGRTGAGKSSLVASLMRMPEPGGQIIIDDQNIQQLSLPSYRAKISVIPQDPVLFSGTLRLNLDPGTEFEDAQIWNALEAVQLKPLVQKQDEKLCCEISEGGSNFSVGEKQLLCLARALLQDNKIIILDEATANVDFATDRLIQETIRSKFHNCTVITIAHRVDTILDYDRVLVLEGGRVVEFDKPDVLLRNEQSKFAELCRLQKATKS